MDKNRRNRTRKINSICVTMALLLSFFAHETIYAAGELPDEESNFQPIMAMTKNNDPAKNYDIQVGWGDMQFVYDYAVPKWDTENLVYIETGTEGWDATGFDGVNNKLQVSNRSNAEITVDLSITINDGVFNDESAENKVQAYFYDGYELCFDVVVQGKGLAISSVTVTGDEKLTELYQETLTTYNPG